MKQKRSKLNQRIMKCIDLSDNENQQIKEMYERKTNHSHFKEDIETYSKINDRIQIKPLGSLIETNKSRET